jgi:hypothetical protein
MLLRCSAGNTAAGYETKPEGFAIRRAGAEAFDAVAEARQQIGSRQGAANETDEGQDRLLETEPREDEIECRGTDETTDGPEDRGNDIPAPEPHQKPDDDAGVHGWPEMIVHGALLRRFARSPVYPPAECRASPAPK